MKATLPQATLSASISVLLSTPAVFAQSPDLIPTPDSLSVLYKAKTESDSIFDSRFQQIFENRQSINELIKLYQLYEIIEEMRDGYQAEFGSSPESGHEHQYLVYGHWFVLFACKLLQVKSQEGQLPTGDDARALVEEAIRRVASACSQQKAVAHYQMFRSPRTKERILGEISAKQIDFFDLLAVS